VLGSLEEGFTECKVPCGSREIQQSQKSRILPLHRGGDGYGGGHDLEEVLITAIIEVPKETVAPGRRDLRRLWAASCRSDLAMADSTVIAVDRKTQWLGRILIGGRPARGHVYFPFQRRECPTSSQVALISRSICSRSVLRLLLRSS
jgi:hypothetical protein